MAKRIKVLETEEAYNQQQGQFTNHEWQLRVFRISPKRRIEADGHVMSFSYWPTMSTLKGFVGGGLYRCKVFEPNSKGILTIGRQFAIQLEGDPIVQETKKGIQGEPPRAYIMERGDLRGAPVLVWDEGYPGVISRDIMRRHGYTYCNGHDLWYLPHTANYAGQRIDHCMKTLKQYLQREYGEHRLESLCNFCHDSPTITRCDPCGYNRNFTIPDDFSGYSGSLVPRRRLLCDDPRDATIKKLSKDMEQLLAENRELQRLCGPPTKSKLWHENAENKELKKRLEKAESKNNDLFIERACHAARKAELNAAEARIAYLEGHIEVLKLEAAPSASQAAKPTTRKTVIHCQNDEDYL